MKKPRSGTGIIQEMDIPVSSIKENYILGFLKSL